MRAEAAIFDVDGTLVQGRTERLFFQYLVRTRRLKPIRALGFLIRLAAEPWNRYCNKTYLAEMSMDETKRLGGQCFQESILPRLRSGGVACVRAHQSGGRRIVLLTGSLSFLVLPLKEYLGADWLIATELAHRGPFFTGALLGLHPRGENKRLLLEKLARHQDLDLSCSYGYGDHLEDVPFMNCVGQPVAVNPTRALQRFAQERRWPIEYF
jgi:HAD superfamily hydrolase (TIGR01490 family)